MNFVKYDVKDRVGYIILNRADKRNALNASFITELKETFLTANNDSQVKVIILKADGEVFCAGADLEYIQQLQNNSYEENLKDSTHLMELYKLIYTLDKIVIAQINGHAIAGGAGIVSVCDFTFSVPSANFGYSEVKIGFIPAIVMTFLLRKVGETKTKELLLSGNLIPAKEAQDIGLINYLTEADNLENTVFEFAQKLCNSNSSTSMKITKKMIAEISDLKMNSALKYASEMNAQARSTDDCKKGIAAFLNKEKIIW